MKLSSAKSMSLEDSKIWVNSNFSCSLSVFKRHFKNTGHVWEWVNVSANAYNVDKSETVL